MRLKDYIRNRSYLEGSIVEGYIAKECLIFCSTYLQGVETVFNRPQQHNYFGENAELYKFLIIERILGKSESIILDQKSIA